MKLLLNCFLVICHIAKKFMKKINFAQLEAFTLEFPSQLSQYVETMFHRKLFPLDDIRALMKLDYG